MSPRTSVGNGGGDCEEGDRMSTKNQTGIRVVFGVPRVQMPTMFYASVPNGRKRFVFRPASPAKVFIKTSDGIVGYLIKDERSFWSVGPNLCIGRNSRQ